MGHRDIAHIDGGKAPGAADRRRGYRTAMKHHDLGHHIRVLPGGLTEDDGAAAARMLLGSRPRPTAVLAFNDYSATGGLDTLLRPGVTVPDEISVVGFDDIHLASLAHINLTTIRRDTHTLTQHAVTTATAHLEGVRTHVRETVIPAHLVIRATTATPRGHHRAL